MVELLDCPFCGCEAHIGQWRDTLNPNATWVECMSPSCRAMTDTVHHEDADEAKRMAAALWNRRVNAQVSTPFVQSAPFTVAPHTITFGTTTNTVDDVTAHMVINDLMHEYDDAWQRLAD